LQEVTDFSDRFTSRYSTFHKFAAKIDGEKQTFGTAIAVKGELVSEISLRSEIEWIDKEIDYFEGNLLGATIKTNDGKQFNVVSAYSPAWAVDKKSLEGVDTTGIQLDGNPDVWCTEALWCGLRDTMPKHSGTWIVGGDFNTSVLFDIPSDRGNRQFLQRLTDLGMAECLSTYQGNPTPTFKHSRGSIRHQLDYMFVSDELFLELNSCSTGKKKEIFGNSLSDHLPVIADFDLS
jgi:exonuclease III